MPYGVMQKFKDLRLMCSNTNIANGARLQVGNWSYGTQLTRSGTNAGPQIRSKSRYVTVDGPMKLVTRTVSKGPRLPYKVWSKRLNKYVWARQPIKIYGYERTKSRIKMKGDDLPPNTLWTGELIRTKPEKEYSLTRTLVIPGQTSYPQTIKGHLSMIPFSFWWQEGSAPDPQEMLRTDFYSQHVGHVTQTALSKLYEKVKDQDVNLAQALAERGQTASLIVESTARLANGLIALKHGKLKQAASILLPTSTKEMANDWLVWQFGIKPLVADLQGMLKAVEKQDKYVDYDIQVVSRHSEKMKKVWGVEVDLGTHTLLDELNVKVDVTVKYKVRVRLRSSGLRSLSSLGLTNLASVAWEVTPWSFVVDWLLPIGDFLNNYDAFQGLDVVFVTRTTTVRQKSAYSRVVASKTSGQWVGSGAFSDTHYWEVFDCHREILPEMPPIPYPSFKNPVSTSHLANLTALIRQKFR